MSGIFKSSQNQNLNPNPPSSIIGGQPQAGAPVSSTQVYLPIEEIKDGVLILKDKSLKAVLLIVGTNFGLRSEEEQQAIIASWQNFLNSLEVQIQIIVRSKRIDLSYYLKTLEKATEAQTNELLRYQTQEYVEYLKGLIDVANVMTKEFYVVVPYFPSVIGKVGFLDKIANFFGFKAAPPLENFEAAKAALFQQVELIKGGLENVGLRAAILSTEQLIDLFYNTYNPDISYYEKLTDIKEMGAEIVGKNHL